MEALSLSLVDKCLAAVDNQELLLNIKMGYEVPPALLAKETGRLMIDKLQRIANMQRGHKWFLFQFCI